MTIRFLSNFCREGRNSMKRPLEIVLLFLMALSAPVAAQSYQYFPQIASGGGWFTELYFTNQGTAAVSGIEVRFYDNAGAELSVDSNLGTGIDYVFDLDKGASLVISLIPSSSTVVGYAEVVYPDDSYVRAGEVYRYKPEETVLTEVGVSQQMFFNNFTIPVKIDTSQNLNTGIALVNPFYFNAAQTVVMTLVASDGHVEATTTKSLSKGQHIAEFLTESLFPGLESFTGSLSISCPFGMAVLALRQDSDTYGSISTDFGPVLGPFLLSGEAVNEVEPNDTIDKAQAISGSTIISGSIGSAQDFDIFSFTGKQGDVVSIVCEAQSIGSAVYMDPMLRIYRTYGDPEELVRIGVNYDSGLSGTGDCFLQMVLPEDDEYYIVANNYYSNYGSDYTYKLHIKLP
jgi:hypothetical protein